MVTVPAAINGTFAPAGRRGADVDVFRLKAAPGSEGDYAITVFAARVGSPADPVLAVLDAKGETRRPRTTTSSAATPGSSGGSTPKEGLLVSVRDYFGRGGERFVYRIEVEPVAGAWRSGRAGAPDGPPIGGPGRPGHGRAAGVRRPGDGPGRRAARGRARPGRSRSPRARRKGSWSFSAWAEAPIGAFPLRLAARDGPARRRSPSASAGRSTRSRARGTSTRGRARRPSRRPEPVLAVAEPAPIGLVRAPRPGRVPRRGPRSR